MHASVDHVRKTQEGPQVSSQSSTNYPSQEHAHVALAKVRRAEDACRRVWDELCTAGGTLVLAATGEASKPEVMPDLAPGHSDHDHWLHAVHGWLRRAAEHDLS